MNEREGAEGDFRSRMSYGDYLRLSELLGAQSPLTDAHDELLFIIQHQTSELWMKLAIREIRAACALIRADRVQPAFKLLARVARIFEQLNNAWDVLRTMTPSDYSEFRDRLGQSSGIPVLAIPRDRVPCRKSQPRDAEATRSPPGDHCGAQRNPRRTEPLSGSDSPVAPAGPRRGPGRVAGRGGRAARRMRSPDQRLGRGLRDPAHHWDLYELAEKLIDFEDYLRRWRFNHVTTVERIIGLKRGTGGTSGVGYLKRMLEIELFPELWRVRTRM